MRRLIPDKSLREVAFVASAWFVCRLRRSGLLLPLRISAFICIVFLPVLGAQMGSNSLPPNSVNGTSNASAVIPGTVLGQVINATTGAPVPRALVRLNDRAVL